MRCWTISLMLLLQSCEGLFTYTPPKFDFRMFGTITDIKISGNHGFGIFRVRVKEMSGNDKQMFLSNGQPFVCRFNLNDSIAEVYGPILESDSIGFYLSIEAKQGHTRVYNLAGARKSSRYIVLKPDPIDQAFVETYSSIPRLK